MPLKYSLVKFIFIQCVCNLVKPQFSIDNGLFIEKCDHATVWSFPLLTDWIQIQSGKKLDSVYRFENYKLSFEVKIGQYSNFTVNSDDKFRQIFNLGHSWKTKQPWIMFNRNSGLTVLWRTGIHGLGGGTGNDRLETESLNLPQNTTISINLYFINLEAYLFVDEKLIDTSVIDSSRVQFDDVHFIWTSYDESINDDLPATGSFIKNIRYCRFDDQIFRVTLADTQFCIENGTMSCGNGLGITVLNQFGDLLFSDYFQRFDDFYQKLLEIWIFYRDCLK